MKGNPFTTNVLAKKRYLIHYFFLIWISFLPPILEFWFYWKIFNSNTLLFLALIPLEFIFLYLILVFSSIIFAKTMLIFVNLFHKPREGVFKRSSNDTDYNYWSLRSTIKKWPIWISHTFPVPWHDNLLLKLFGIRTYLSNSIYDGWVSSKYVKLGKNVVIGQAAIVLSTMIIGNYLIIKEINIGDNVIIGSHSYISPGTVIGKNCILSVYTYTQVDQELEEGWVYSGMPAKKIKLNNFIEINKEPLLKKKIEL